jgi:hypothetical protein
LWPMLRRPISFTSFGEWAGEIALKTFDCKRFSELNFAVVTGATDGIGKEYAKQVNSIEVVYELPLTCLDSSWPNVA